MTESYLDRFRKQPAFGPKQLVSPIHQSGVFECSHTFKEILEAESDAQLTID